MKYEGNETIEKICSGLNISMAEFFSEDTPCREKVEYTSEELEMVDIYRSLNKKEQQILLSYIKGFARRKLN